MGWGGGVKVLGRLAATGRMTSHPTLSEMKMAAQAPGVSSNICFMILNLDD